MIQNKRHNENKYRIFSTIFSRRVFTDVLKFDDYSYLDSILQYFPNNRCKYQTYTDYLSYVYKKIKENYRSEYVYKNEIISKYLLQKFGTQNSVIFSEYRVNKSIADLVFFNGESKVFEIKTEYDSPTRLENQINDYKMVFDKIYIVIPEQQLNLYENLVDTNIGIILLCEQGHTLRFEVYRDATKNTELNPSAIFDCMRKNEYESVIESIEDKRPMVSDYMMYRTCKAIFISNPIERTEPLFINAMKQRKNITTSLKKYPYILRQMLLSLNLNDQTAELLLNKLNQPLN